MADSDIAALIAAGPGGGPASAGSASAPTYLGVPEGFVNQKPRVMTSRLDVGRPDNYDRAPVISTPPRYTSGAELVLGSSLSPEKRARIQGAMDQAGLYGANGSYRMGLWDDSSQEAFSKVLAYANQNGIDADAALDELVRNPIRSTKAKLGRAGENGAVTQLTPGVDLEQTLQSVAEKRLGRRLKTAEVQKFVSAYQGLEYTDNSAQVAAQRAAQGQDAEGSMDGANGQDTTLTPQAPSPSAGAEGYIDKQYAQEAAGQDVFGYYDVIKNLIGGG